MTHAGLIRRLLATVLARSPGHPLRVAIDGPDAAGKTTLADELASAITDRSVIRASVDGFHRPRAERSRRGSLSPEGYFLDSFDDAALVTGLLAPLGPDGDRRYRTACFDYRTDQPVPAPQRIAADNAILLVDGIFLLRHELREHWDLAVYLDVRPVETLRRALTRDLELFGDDAEITRRYMKRYLPGQQLYRDRERPLDRADIVVANDDPAHPIVMQWRDPRANASRRS